MNNHIGDSLNLTSRKPTLGDLREVRLNRMSENLEMDNMIKNSKTIPPNRL